MLFKEDAREACGNIMIYKTLKWENDLWIKKKSNEINAKFKKELKDVRDAKKVFIIHSLSHPLFLMTLKIYLFFGSKMHRYVK